MERIGFFGGCFNPPTNIHINVAKKLIESGKLDRIIFVPVNDFYEKKDLESSTHRYNMLKLATKKYSRIEVNDVEIKENRKLYAVDVFEIICRKFANEQQNDENIFMVMGLDNYKKMSKWKDYSIIKDKYNYIIVDRNENQISSTQIRNMIKNNDKSVLKYLSKDVYEYIKKNRLYNIK